jgi:ubiquinone/menaquinone biosynthesis C-methylase UbiE
MEQARLSAFGRIDQTGDPAYFIHFLDAACAEASFQAYKRRLVELMGLGGCLRFLDVGCGTGDDVRAMAELVGSRGQVVGVDSSQAMIHEAQRRAAALEQSHRVSFQVADALALPFGAGTFVASRADRSLMHVGDARQAVAEMVRVTQSKVAVFEVDFETLTLDTDKRALMRRIANAWCDSFRNGWLGRHMPALFVDVGLREIIVEPHTLMLTPELSRLLLGSATVDKAIEQGVLSPAEGQEWLRHLDDLQQSGRFFSTLTGYLVCGRV